MADLLAVTGQLAGIIRCNAPMVPGLDAAQEDAPNPKIAAILVALRSDIASGLSLSESMANRPWFFPKFCVDLVRTGEQTGSLHGSFAHVTEHVQNALQLRSIVTGYSLYVGGVFAVQAVLMTFLCCYVLPQFADVLSGFGPQTPVLVGAVLRLGYGLRAGWPLVLVAIAVLAVLVVWLAARRHSVTGGLLGRVCGLRRLVVKSNWAHASRVMETLLRGGVPLNTALEDAASADINPFFARQILRVKERVEQGQSLAEALGKEPGIPESFRGLVSLGESSGLLPEAFGRIARLYHRQTLKTWKMALDAVAPLLILAVGVVTGVFYYSIFALDIGMITALVDQM